MQEKLYPKSKLQAPPLFARIPDKVKEAAVVNHHWNEMWLTSEFAVLPPNVVLMAQMEDIKAVFQKETTEM